MAGNRRKLGALGAAVLICALAAAPAGAAAPKLDPKDFKDVLVGAAAAQYVYKGVEAKCGGSRRAFTAGAAWSEPEAATSPATAKLTSVAPTKNLRAAFVNGYTTVSGELTLTAVARCAPKAQLKGAVVRTRKTRVEATDVQSHVAGLTASCPDGTRVIGGGAVWHRPGLDPLTTGPASDYERLLLMSSAPTANGRGWYGAGINGNIFSGEQVFEVSAVCLPVRRLPAMRVVSEQSSVDVGGGKGITAYCPRRFVPLAGGGYWSFPGITARAPEPPRDEPVMGATFAQTPPPGWYSNGYNPGGPSGLIFGTRAICIHR